MKQRMALCLLALISSIALAQPALRTKTQPNVVPDLLLPPETQWNHFSPDQIPDFKIPKRFDPVLGTNMPVKILIWHNIGRNCFRTVANGTEKEMYDSERVAMLNKGVSAINFFCMRPTEQVPPGGNPSDPTGLPLDSLTQIVVGNGSHDDAFEGGWDAGIKWWADNVDGAAGPLGAVRSGKPSPIFFACCDNENKYSGAGDQDAANHLVVGTYAMLERTAGYAGQMYLGPLNTMGYAHDDIYDGGGKTVGWFNAADDTVPERFRGLKMDGNPRIPGCFEVVHSYECFLPEGYQTKDQNDKDFVVISHFGKDANVEHWAARVGGLTEASYQYTKAGGQKLYPMLKTVLERFGGYTFSPDKGDRWIKQYAQYGITLHSDADNVDYLSTIGAEYMPPFEVEAQMLLACFCGADGITFWGSAFGNDVVPRPKEGNPRRGQKYNDPSWGNLDLESMNYVLKAFWRMSAKATLESGKKVSFYDICDGTEEYLNWDTNVSYDDGKTFPVTRAIDWQLEKRTAVRAVVNCKKKVIFILAFQPIGVEQSKVVVKYNENGANFKKTLNVPAKKVMIYAYDLNGVKPVTKK